MSAIDEDQFWSSLDEQAAFENTAGDPPYSVERVGARILTEVDPLRLLDLGCGQGRLTNSIAQRLGDRGVVHGVDISRPLLNRAVIDGELAHLDNVHYWHGDGRTIPSGCAGRFSGAYSIAMFQHVPDDARWGYLRLVHQRLEPGGVFVFTIAVGHEDEFLNHQILHPQAWVRDVAELFDVVTLHAPDENDWTWVTARKES